MFKKILIANRGEIACRIMRSARDMGVASVAVYSDADRDALHVHQADEAVHIGASPALESYLKIENIIEAAKTSGAEAIHPGYGFLSENPNFVEAVEAAGMVFIGPSADAIRAMGLKDAAKKLMENSGVPVVPGYHGANQDAEFLAREAEKIGYPVLIKARAGGGGKGMRLVESEADFVSALEGAMREGQASFGDGHVLIEKFILSPRHIEIQVFGDSHGNVVHMFERDCSLQRRHQKVIEEAPAPGMNDKMRSIMGEAAVKAAKAVNYCGAGTVEFIVDGSDELRSDGFWFMEMNTRLQVEHPVTEMITGLDLVALQLRVADGEKLPVAQNELSINGWAFETRIYAEDPANRFLPSVGDLTNFVMPEKIARVDAGIGYGGSSNSSPTISPHYDPMIGKIITHGKSRDEALAKMRAALVETYISGVRTNVAFLSALCHNQEFRQGGVDTGLIEREIEALIDAGEASDLDIAIGAVMIFRKLVGDKVADYQNWRNWGTGKTPVDFSCKERQFACTVATTTTASGGANSAIGYIVEFDEQIYHLDLALLGNDSSTGKTRISWDEDAMDIICVETASGLTGGLPNGLPSGISVSGKAKTHLFEILDPLDTTRFETENSAHVHSPMPGLLKSVKVSAGESVSEGEVLVIVEAMKMEHSLVAPRDGEIEAVHGKEGEQVDDGALLVSLVEQQGE